jgi:aminoglycoside phosphotransferase (APT) family kinase protein
MLERAAHVLTHVPAGHPSRAWLTDYLAHHRALGPIAPPARRAEQVVHGDYQDSNVLFDERGDVTAVIDWDKAETRTPAEEVLRAVHLSFHLAPATTQAFIAGYRTTRALTDDDLDGGAEIYGYERDRSIWLLEELHVNGNQRLQVLAEDATFVPFADQWAACRRETRSRTTPVPRLH